MANEKTFLISISVILAGVIYGSPAFCDFIVVSSQSSALKVGSAIADSAAVEIKDQEQLRLMDKESGETRILIGPYKGTVADYNFSCPSIRQMTVGCLSKSRSKPIGATRGIQKIE
jgi:hypothetical protein